MPLEPRIGAILPIPCRTCGRFLPLTVTEGAQELICDKCERRTFILVEPDQHFLRVFSGNTPLRPRALK